MALFRASTPDSSASIARRSRLVTWLQITLLGVAAMLAGFFAVVSMPQSYARTPQQDVFQGPPGGRGPGGFRGGPGAQPELEVRARFDANKDKVLDAAERKAAREWLGEQGAGPGGFAGRRGFGRRGGGFADGTPGPKLTPADVRTYGSEPLYAPDVLRTIFLQFGESDWEGELEAFHNTDVEVPATVTVDGRTYQDVGVHFRGMSSYMMVPAGLKRSLNLSFDFLHDKQDLLGFRTLNLLNANGDPTFVRGLLYSEIAQAYIAAPRINFVRVVINGESWGVYLNAEQFNKDFTESRFGSDKGARWKVPGSPNGRAGMEYLGADPAAYKRIYEIKTKDTEESWRDLITLFRVLNDTPVEQLEAKLSPILDIDGALKFLALDVALVNSDGYWTRASDYSIYKDPAGRFHVIPHDVNEAMAEEGGRGFGGPRGGFAPPPGVSGPPRAGGTRPGAAELDPLVGLQDSSKPLRSRLLAVPALRARYLAYVHDIAETWLDWSKIGPLVEARQALIAADVARDTRKLYSTERFSSDLTEGENSLKSFLAARRAYLLRTTTPDRPH